MFNLSRIIFFSGFYLICTKILTGAEYGRTLTIISVYPNEVDSNTLVDFSDLRAGRISDDDNQRYLDGKFTFKKDFDNTYDMKAIQEISTTGHFDREAPFNSVYNMKLCEFLHGIYKNFLHPSIKDHSDFTINGDKSSCVIKAGTYYIDNAPGDPDSMPDLLHTGDHLMNLTFYKDDVEVGGFALTSQFYDERH